MIDLSTGWKGFYTLITASIFAVFLALSAAFATDADRFIRSEVPWNKSINLEEFGGPHVEVSIRTREMSYVAAEIADYTRLLPVVRANTYSVPVNDYYDATVSSGNRVVLLPARDTRRVEKKDGVQFPGTRLEMYLLYHDQTSGMSVYFLDAITSQNHDSLVVVIPPPPAAPPPPPTAASPTQSDRQKGDHILSSELLAWYLRLQHSQQSLDLSDSAAVARFNEQVAEYHEAVKKARETRSAETHHE